MRILITGFVTLVIWSFLSMWLYVDILKPATKKQVIVQPAPENQNREADSLAKFYASMPRELKIFFDFDKSKMIVPADADSSIAKFREWITIHPAAILLVNGHTDFIGTPEYNQKLAATRAEIVKKFLVEKGLPLEKMETSWSVEDQSPANQITSTERAEHRRTEVTIKK